MFLFFKNVSVLRRVNKAHKLPCQGRHNDLRKEETENTRPIPAKNRKLIRVLHTIRNSFTDNPESLHTLCATNDFWQHSLDVFNFILSVFPAKREANKRIRQLFANTERRDDVRGLK